MKIERIKGFRDQYPEDMEPRKRLLEIAEDRAERFGFKKIDVPSLESLDLYRLKSGDELVSQTFSFTDRGGREVTMIPEFTPSVVRMLTSRKDIPRPVRWYGTPKLWRYEEPQAGRLREHIQFNADIFGPDTAEADAEVIGLAASILDSLGLGGEYEIRISNRQLTEYVLKQLGVSNTEKAFQVIDKFRKVERDDFLSSLVEIGAEQSNAETLCKIVEESVDIEELPAFLEKHISVPKDNDFIRRTVETGKLVKSYTKSNVVYDLSIVRGLSYYTGIVFEAFDIKGEFRSILGGGRYNNLASLLSDQDIPAMGFGMGDAVIELLMKRTGKWNPPDHGSMYYLAVLGSGAKSYAFELANEVRKKKTAVMELSARGLSAQLKSAASMGCSFAIIIGDKERSEGKITVRDLNTGDQSSMSRVEFLKSL